MRTKHILLASSLMLVMRGALAQAWDEGGNNVFLPTKYVGCDGASAVPLKVMNNANFPIQFWTDSLHRMQLYHTMPPATINGFPNIERDGFLAVSPVENFYTNPGPFSRLHLVDSAANANIYSQDYGWRPWMRNGITMTGNSDQMYIGQKYVYVDSLDHTSGEIDDRSDAVIEWSDHGVIRPQSKV